MRKAIDDDLSGFFPAKRWPIETAEQRQALMTAIERGVEKKVLTPRDGYTERLRYAYRCLDAGI